MEPASTTMIDVAARNEAASLLFDVPLWELPERKWAKVHEVLMAMRAAGAAGDVDELRQRTDELEWLSPRRMTRLGTVPVVPPPPPTLAVRDRLVHELGVDLANVCARPAGAPPIQPGPGLLVTQQELVVHHFAAMLGPNAVEAFARLCVIWNGCRTRFGATEAVPTLGLPVVMPTDPSLAPAEGAIAAAQNAGATVQMILRRDHNTLTLSAMCAARPDPGDGWSTLDREWDEVAPADVDPLLGVVRLYLGLAPAAASPFRTLDQVAHSAGFPQPGVDHGWPKNGTMSAGCAISELTPGIDVPVERRFVVLAECHDDAGLSALAWSRGDPEATPFTRYLLHAAKVGYQARVRKRSADGLDGAYNGTLDLAQITVAITHLKDMMTSIRLAREGMTATMGGDAQTGFVADDRSVADWLVRQLEVDQTYLESTRERAIASHGVRTTDPGRGATIGLVTALPEEFGAMRELIDDPTERTLDGDYATYVLGTLPSAHPRTPHRVALTLLGGTANPAAAAGVARMLSGLDSINQVVMVGIAAGIPAPERPEQHVRLGDIVVSTWGIVAYDHVVEEAAGPRGRQDFPTPAAYLTRAADLLAADERVGQRPWEDLLDRLTTTQPAFARPHRSTDQLFAGDAPGARRLRHPSAARSGHRPDRPKVHYAAIGSADRSMRSADVRDALAMRWNIRAIEMEGHGVGTAAFTGGRQYLVVRGISDYADSHLDCTWRPYASAVAAAYTAALLRRCPPLTAHGGQVMGSDPDGVDLRP
jgi:nucleoside phosphorylase